MAHLYYNSTYSTDGLVNPFYDLTYGDDLFFDVNAHVGLSGAGSVGISMSGDAVFRLSGSLYASQAAVETDAGTVVVASTGTLVGGGMAVHSTGAFTGVVNMGTILGAIFAQEGVFSFNNSGVFSGELSLGEGGNSLVNTGTMINRGAAMYLESYGDEDATTLTNSGLISSSTSYAIDWDSSGTDDVLLNSGTIVGARSAVIFGSGDDTLINSGLIAGDVDLNSGDDTYDGSHGYVQGQVFGSTGSDTLIGNDGGNDVLNGGENGDLLDGGAGDDTASYTFAQAGVTVDMLDATKNGGDATGDTLVSIERLRGGDFGDTLAGDDAANRISGNGGNDTLSGRGGSDVLYGAGDSDTLDGGAGNDRLDGGAGFDTASYASSSAAVTVSLAIAGAQATGGAGTDILVGIEALFGTQQADRFTGSAAANTLSGANGNDVLDGKLGTDTLIGGKNADTFIFSTALGADNVDTVVDFVVADDTIDLARSVFAAFSATGAIGASAFAIATAAQDADDRIIYNSANGALFYDADGLGGAAAVQVATLHNHLLLTNADFVVI